MFDCVSLRTAEISQDKVWPLLPDRYLIERHAGGGGGGSVYRAYDTLLERHVAIKIPITLAAGDVAEEAISQAAIEHVNIPRLLDAGDTLDHRIYLSMEFVDGEDIRTYCREKRATLRQRIALLVQVCDAVHYVHTSPDRARAHRDIRVANVMVTSKDGIPKVMDFGMSARLDQLHDNAVDPGDDEESDHNAADWFARGVEVDLYSIGIIAWQLLVGSPDSGNAHRLDRQDRWEVEKIHRRLLSLIDEGGICLDFADSLGDSPRGLRRKLKGDLRYILANLIGRGEQHYQTARDVEVDLQCFLGRFPLKSKRASWQEIGVRFVQRNPRLTMVATSLSLVVLVVGSFWFSTRMELFQSAQREGNLNVQLADIYQGTNPERPSESITRVPISMIDMLLSSAEALRPSGHPYSDEEIRKTAQLVDSLSANGLVEAAERAWQELYDDQITQHGENSPVILPARTLLAAAKLKNGQGQEALNLAQENAEQFGRFKLPPNDDLRLWNAHIMAATQKFGGHYEVALDIEEQVLERNGGRRNELWADANHIIALAAISMGDPTRALNIMNEVEVFYHEARGKGNVRTLRAAETRVTALEELGRPNEAIAQMRTIVDAMQEIFPDGGPPLLRSKLLLAKVLGRAERFEEAKPVLRSIAEQQRYSEMRLHALVELAGIEILAGKKVPQARQDLLDLMPLIRKELRPDSPILTFAKSYVNLADSKLLDAPADIP